VKENRNDRSIASSQFAAIRVPKTGGVKKTLGPDPQSSSEHHKKAVLLRRKKAVAADRRILLVAEAGCDKEAIRGSFT
jgi:hypothetical protein